MDILVYCVDIGQTLNNKTTNRALFRFVHPVKRHVVRISVKRESGAKSIVAALVRGPKESVSLEIERRLEALGLIERLRSERKKMMAIFSGA